MATEKWPEETKAKALALYLEVGPSQAARATGVPSGTVRYWASLEGLTGDRQAAVVTERLQRADLAEEERQAALAQAAADKERRIEAANLRSELKRAELRELLMDRAVEALHRMDDEHVDFKGKDAIKVTYPKPSAADMKNYAMTAAILLDKYRLELGEVTDRTESIGSESELDREIARLIDEVERRGQTQNQSEAMGEAPPT